MRGYGVKTDDMCKHYQYRYTDDDIVSGHSDYEEFCTKSGEEKLIIGFITCNKCKERCRR